MLNSKKLKEVCEVLNKEKITFGVANVSIEGNLKNTKQKIDTIFWGADTTNFDIALTELEMHVCLFESKLAEILEPKLTGEMVLMAGFKYDGDVRDIGNKLKYMGYVEHIDKECIHTVYSYNIYEGKDYIITISLIEKTVMLSVKNILENTKDFGEYFLDLKMCMTSLYNKIAKR